MLPNQILSAVSVEILAESSKECKTRALLLVFMQADIPGAQFAGMQARMVRTVRLVA